MYKIRGTGDVRSVMDGERLVGRVHRREGRVESATVTKSTIKWHSRPCVMWAATWADSDEFVRERDRSGRPFDLQRSALKHWADPNSWQGPRLVPRGEK